MLLRMLMVTASWILSLPIRKGCSILNRYLRGSNSYADTGIFALLKIGLLCLICSAQLKASGDNGKLNGLQRDSLIGLPKPQSPATSMKLAQVPEGFTLELFASEPDIGKPIAMDWDERGRLWIIETVAYPNSIRGRNDDGDDRILIC